MNIPNKIVLLRHELCDHFLRFVIYGDLSGNIGTFSIGMDELITDVLIMKNAIQLNERVTKYWVQILPPQLGTPYRNAEEVEIFMNAFSIIKDGHWHEVRVSAGFHKENQQWYVHNYPLKKLREFDPEIDKA